METRDYSSRKRELRQGLKTILQSLSDAEKEAESAAVVDRLGKVFGEVSAGNMVLMYAALALETNVWEIIQFAPHLDFVLPRVRPDSQVLECRRFSDPHIDLAKGAYGVLEPIPKRCPIVDVSSLAVIVVPGLAFTKKGARLGKGGGYYDRLLSDSQMTARTIGVGFECQLCQDIPMEDHDQFLDCVIAPSGVWSCQAS